MRQFDALSRDDLQGLYDHLGTIPYAPGSWSHNWRAALSEALAIDAARSVRPEDASTGSKSSSPGGH